VALRQLAPKPYSVERVETLPALQRFLAKTGDSEIVWLSDGSIPDEAANSPTA
jgi:hypothetical protein